MCRIATLKAALTLSDVARLLDFKPKTLSYVLYKQPAAAKYKTFQIPKRNGGQRTICAPIDALKVLQHKLSDLLQDCVDEINAANKRKDRTAHGFKRGRSIITNARQHRHRRWIFNLDLEDFFPSINFGRIRGFLIKNRDFELHEDVATVITQIACHENVLPQGSPCSPVISNLVAHLLDMRLVKLASAAGCTYTRYADDLTFSTNKKKCPAEIAVPSGADGARSHLWSPGEPLQKIVKRSGFRINGAKTHLMYRTSRQNVTGLVVNEKINIRREYRHNVRAMVHSLVNTGGFTIPGVTQRDGRAVLEKRPGHPKELHGMLGFIDSIDAENKETALDCRSYKRSSQEEVYREFLIYSMFYAAQAPMVLCEGKTDIVYLTQAIRSLAGDFPGLAEVMPDKKICLKVRFYRYPQSSTARLLGLCGGGSDLLKKFIVAYNKETRRFRSGLKNPVVILYDNDSGGKDIQNAIHGISKAPITGNEPFVHVTRNMYAVPTPGKPSKIEDLFDDTIKATLIDGKTFNCGNKFDKNKHYGKAIFAHKVVRPRSRTIDFTGFRPLLTNLASAINKHKALITT